MTDDEAPKSDESPATDAGAVDDTTPEGAPVASSDAGTEASGSADADATLPETPSAAPAATPVAAAASDDRAGVFVPRWVAFLVGGLVALLLVGGAGFALGRATDDDHDDGRPAAGVFPGGQPGGGNGGPQSPGGQGGGNDGLPFPLPGGGNGGGRGDLPTVPNRGVLLGVSVETTSGDTSGARVAEVVSGSPAEEAGLEAGDVITKVDDTEVTNAPELVAAIQEHGSGDEVTITYVRDGQTDTADVTLGGDRSDSGSQSSSSAN